MDIKTLEALDGWRIWKKSWMFSKPHWFSMFVITVTAILATIGSSLIPIFGSAISTALTGVFSFGLMCVTSEIKKNNKVDFKILFAGFDNGVIQRLYSLIFLWIGFGLVQGFVTFFVRGIPYEFVIVPLFSILISVAIISFVIFAPALIIWYDKSTKEAIDLNFEAAKKNIAALTVYTIAPAILFCIPMVLMIAATALLPQLLAAIIAVIGGLAMLVALIVLCPATVASLYFLFEAIFLGQPVEEQPQQQSPQQSALPQ